MNEPMTPERRAEIRDRAAYLHGHGADADEHEIELSAGTDVPALLGETNRLYAENERLQRVADREHRNFVHTHDGLNRLSEEARQMTEAKGAEEQWAQVCRAVAATEAEKRRRKDDGRKLVDAHRTIERLRAELAAARTKCADDIGSTVAAWMQEQQRLIATLHDRIAELEARPSRATVLRQAASALRRVEREDTPQGALGTRTGLLRAALMLDERADAAERDDAGKDTPTGDESTRAAEIEQLHAELKPRPSMTAEQVAIKGAVYWEVLAHRDDPDLSSRIAAAVTSALAEVRAEGCAERHVVADASETPECIDDCPGCEPTPLRWGLDDTEYGDDDSTTLLLSGPRGEPYVLELDPDRAAALRDNLAGPDAVQQGNGACERCGEPPESWCTHCAGCACPDGRAETHAPGGSCPNASAVKAGERQ
ncbi:hypothetical protein [Streptomyces sp. NPDC006784]|uniref:hypothetical protein n=1 Tax=Streptomyces sp. NPDC006784 TaxID=3364764 RepID=UPI003698DDB6